MIDKELTWPFLAN